MSLRPRVWPGDRLPRLLKTDDAIDRLALTGQDDASDTRMFPKIAGERQTVFPRQHSIEDHPIHRPCLEDTAHSLAAFGGADVVTPLAEIGLDKIVDCWFVVDDQNMELTGSWCKYYHNGIFCRCSLPVIVEAMKACANCCAQWLKQWGIGD
jgi:hypothetical protein